jgi:hypothetical protein
MARTAYRLVLGLGVALLPVPVALAQREPPPLPPGLKPQTPPPRPAEGGRRESAPAAEVQARGPVHEAFAEPATPPSPAPVVPKQPPAPVEEEPPEQKPAGKEVQWIPGYWQWDEERKDHLWVSGCWRIPPPGKVWLPGRWQRASGGWQWVSGSWADEGQSEVELLPPPPPSREEEIPRLDPGEVYEPGCWVYREKDYVWRPGFALTVPKGWVWVSARYSWTPAGCLFVEGHWDYPLRERGLLFAPVAFPARGAASRYVPGHVVREECLLGALFVRAAARHYYFGDYFEKGYERQYVPWTRYRPPGAACDSLFGYYRRHAGDRRWEQSIQSLIAARYAGESARPPRTLAAQEAFVREMTAERTLSADQVGQVTVLAPLGQFERHGYRVEKLRREDAAAYRQSATALARFGADFQQSEFELYSERRGDQWLAGGPVIVKWKKGHPHGGPPGQLKKLVGPPLPGFPFEGEGLKGGKHKKGKGKKK